MINDRLQYEFSDSLGGDYFDLQFSQGDELGEWLRVVHRARAATARIAVRNRILHK